MSERQIINERLMEVLTQTPFEDLYKVAQGQFTQVVEVDKLTFKLTSKKPGILSVTIISETMLQHRELHLHQIQDLRQQ